MLLSSLSCAAFYCKINKIKKLDQSPSTTNTHCQNVTENRTATRQSTECQRDNENTESYFKIILHKTKESFL